ncbi:unnamed protein product, partial [Ectocarpus sp. 12 AP-2014]
SAGSTNLRLLQHIPLVSLAKSLAGQCYLARVGILCSDTHSLPRSLQVFMPSGDTALLTRHVVFPHAHCRPADSCSSRVWRLFAPFLRHNAWHQSVLRRLLISLRHSCRGCGPLACGR